MLDLLDLCSLDVHYDAESNALLYGENIRCASFQKVCLKNLTPTLLNKSLIYPELVYDEYFGVFDIADADSCDGRISYDLVNIPAGLLGIEYIKTHIYYSENGCEANKASSIVEVLYGSLNIIIQKNYPTLLRFLKAYLI